MLEEEFYPAFSVLEMLLRSSSCKTTFYLTGQCMFVNDSLKISLPSGSEETGLVTETFYGYSALQTLLTAMDIPFWDFVKQNVYATN